MDFETNAIIDDFKPIANKNIRLNIATISLYRFWARANVRDFLWAKTRLGNEPFVFHGSGDELFKGFIFALIAIFIPIWLIPKLVELSGDLALIGIISFASTIVLSFISGFGIWRARAYLLGRTSYRGIKFSLDKGALNFAFAFLFHTMLLGITFGWWHPKMRQSLAKRIWSKTRWGNVKFEYLPDPNIKSLGGAFAVGWIGTAFLGAIYFILITITFGINELNSENVSPLMYTIFSYISLAGLWLIAIFCFGSYRAEVLRKISSAIYFDGARIENTLYGRPFFKMTIKNAFLMLISFGLYAPYAAFNYWKLVIEQISVFLPPAGLIQIFQSAQIVDGTAEGIDDAFELPFFDMSPL